MGEVNPLIKEAVAYAPMLAGAGDAHTGYWNCRQSAYLIAANVLGKSGKSKPYITRRETIKQVISCLNQVNGMTDKKVIDLRLHILDETLEEIRFKDGIGKLILIVNPIQAHHVYVFNRYDNCKFAGYVGWIYASGLKKMVKSIKNLFC